MFKVLKNSKAPLIVLLSILLLTIGFFSNQWNAANQEHFDRSQTFVESLIIGKLAKSQQDGIFSSGGLTGWCNFNSENDYLDQYRVYTEKLKILSYAPYKSQIGFQGITFSFLDYLTTFPNELNLKVFKIISSLMSATAISLIILWAYYEFNIFASLVLLITSIYSQWLTLFGSNLYWVLGAFYLPMIVAMYVLFYEDKTDKYSEGLSAILISFALFIKCLFNGYEYITTTILMMIAPYVYYAYFKQWPLKKFFLRAFFVLAGSAISIFISTLILISQIFIVDGSIGRGFSHILFVFKKRSHGEPSSYMGIYRDSLLSNPIDVVESLLEKVAIDLNNLIPNFPAWQQFKQIQFSEIISLFVTASILSIILSKYSNNLMLMEKKRLMALVITTWFSLLAPISWFIIFKAHSYIHTNINAIAWHMPFTLFGFLLCGLFGHYFFLSISRSSRILYFDFKRRK